MTASSHGHGAPAARSGLDLARALYHRLPPGWLRNQLSCVAYRALYPATIARYRYARGVFTLTPLGRRELTAELRRMAALVADGRAQRLLPGER